MSLETIYYISQIIAVLAVIASMIFVGIQIRQNTEQAKRNEEATKAAAAEAAHRSFLDFYNNQASKMAHTIVKGEAGLEALSAEDRYVYYSNAISALANIQEAHKMWLEGSLSEDRWHFWDNFASIVTVPRLIKNVWQDRRFMFSDVFQDYFDRKIDARDSLSISSADWAADPSSTNLPNAKTPSEEGHAT